LPHHRLGALAYAIWPNRIKSKCRTDLSLATAHGLDDLKNLNEIDWEVMESRYWNDTPTLPDRKRRRQAEFLIKDCCPWGLFSEIGVINSRMESRVKMMLENSMHQPTVQIYSNWYY